MRLTLLAVCPNSDAVLEAAIRVAADNAMPLLLAATLNQVDRDGGYTGWTPRAFVGRVRELAALYELCAREGQWLPRVGPSASGFPAALRAAVVDSGRWRKWLWPEEAGRRFAALAAARQEWLIVTVHQWKSKRPPRTQSINARTPRGS